jgi:hypothetical protein
VKYSSLISDKYNMLICKFEKFKDLSITKIKFPLHPFISTKVSN